MAQSYSVTRHAHERITARGIPAFIAGLIIEYGEPRDAGDGALSYMLTKSSLREFRRVAGPTLTNLLSQYRSRNAYVVAAAGRIITVAFASNHTNN